LEIQLNYKKNMVSERKNYVGNQLTLGPTAHATLLEVDFGFSIAKI
jgi:hypothetical protein